MTDKDNNINQQIRHIGHEIRNSLSICDIYSEIIKKCLIKENITNPSIENAVNCIQNAVQLIGNNLLELKSLGGIVQHVCDSKKLIEQTVNMSKVYTKEKAITFEEQLADDIKIYVDENKFQACLINVIKNAVEAIENKGFINISSKVEDNNLIIHVSNNGKAISENMKQSLFEDGFTTKKTGSGIGLYLCKKYLNSQNADISLLSSDNKKTIFTISVKVYPN